MSRLLPTNLRDQALSLLKLRLISGDLVPGEIYSAAGLAQELGVSNSPVREAMLTLVNEGLMEAVRNRGFRVVPLSDHERRNIYDIRLLLEIPAMAQLAARRSVVEPHGKRFSALAASIVSAAGSGDIVAYLDADRQFHMGLLDLLENQHLSKIIDNLRDQSRHYGLKRLSESGQLVASAEEHAPILAAILTGDEAKTARLMRDHLQHLVGDWAG
ncbi:GntR family transcriptional regulator [Aureimonas leprariae]|uniref:GntR family transcriptional regulator n=1 Tax=Plantimonas leprariae TaxID=2615207 RepID=A0A7V7TV79_9HYPH|nr:GntR family transcriptional regulator [Aureimonas leprariae]KAB0677349.1 GntR family transcriptional regulator [Aureimonas leprariae]